MTVNLRSLLSVVTAVGIAAAGVAANSAEAWSTTVNIPAPPATASVTIQSPVVTYGFQAPGTGFNLGIAGLTRNPGGEVGRDTLIAMAAGGSSASGNVPQATWSCRTSLFNGFTVTKQTNLAYGKKADPLPGESGSGNTAYAPDASGPNRSYPRVAATWMLADCN